MSGRISHWKTEQSKNNRYRIVKLLSETGPHRFTELQARLHISAPALNSHLKELEGEETVERFWDKTKEAAVYRINSRSQEAVNAQVRGYEAIQFIEELRNPISFYQPITDGKGDVALFASLPGKNRQIAEVVLRAIVNSACKTFGLVPSLSEGERVAVIVTLEKKGVKP